MNEVMFISLLFLALFILSSVPIIKLKHDHDYSDYSDTLSKKCKSKKTPYDVRENETYLYMMCRSLYDTNFQQDIVAQSREFPYHMNLYMIYRDYSMPCLIIMFLGFIFYFILFVAYYGEYYTYLSFLFVLFLILASYIIIYSLVLKKITEIYNDSKITEYYNYMVFINTMIQHLKEKNNVEYLNLMNTITSNYELSDYIHNNNYVKHIVFNKNTLKTIHEKFEKLYVNTDGTTTDKYAYNDKNIIELDKLASKIQEYYKFHTKLHYETLKHRISIVCSYIIYYFFIFCIFITYIVKILNISYDIDIQYLYLITITGFVLSMMIYYAIQYLHT
jgi:hypothetical protein